MDSVEKIWLNGIYPYFRILKRINELLIMLIKENYSIEQQEDCFLELTSELLRILPFKLERDEKSKMITEIKLLDKSGILLLKKYFKDLKEDYTQIINNNFVSLVQIIKIRNKYIHEPHNIKCICFVCGGNSARAGFKYKNEKLDLNTDSLIKIIKEINSVFIKIKIKFEKYVEKLDEKDKNHPYVLNMKKNYLLDYNKNISELLNIGENND